MKITVVLVSPSYHCFCSISTTVTEIAVLNPGYRVIFNTVYIYFILKGDILE